MGISLRSKLAVGFGAAVLVPSLVGATAVLSLIGARAQEQARTEIATDLSLARAIFDGEQLRLTERALELRRAARVLLYKKRTPELRALLDDARSHGRLDVALVTDSRGRVLYRAGSPRAGDRVDGDPFVRQALRGETAEGVQVASPKQLRSDGLQARAFVGVVPTRHAYRFDRAAESRGMMLKTATPMVNTSGRVTGALVVAVLLNRDTWVVDRACAHAGEDSTSIYLGPVCVATSRTDDKGARTIGTLASSAVGQDVLGAGRRFIGETAGDDQSWMVSGEPIRDRGGKVIGILQAAVSQERFTTLRNRAVLTFGSVILVTLVSGLVVSMLGVRWLTQPLEDLVGVARRIGSGDLTARADVRGSDEVSALCEEFNEMAQTLERQIQKLNRSNELKSEFIAIASHELRTPVAVIKSYVDLMAGGAYDGRPEDLKERLSKVERQVTSLASLVDDLLDLSRLERHRLVAPREPVRVGELVEDVVADVSKATELGSRVLTSSISEQPMLVYGDEPMLRRMLMNLVGNSVKFTSDGDEIGVSAQLIDDGVEIVVEDTGSGIAEEDLPFVFTPFFQAEESIHRTHPGLGLGLSLAKEIVELHGGTITVTSESGKGTKAVVRLALGASSEAAANMHDT